MNLRRDDRTLWGRLFAQEKNLTTSAIARMNLFLHDLLKVMTRGAFQGGQQVWILDRDGSKIGATVENVFKQTIDSEVPLSTVLPA